MHPSAPCAQSVSVCCPGCSRRRHSFHNSGSRLKTKLCVLVIVQKCSHYFAPCHTLHYWWAAHFHLAFALFLFPRHDLLPTYSNFFSGEIEFCADTRHVSVGYLAEPAIFTGYEPKHLARRQGVCRTRGFICQTNYSSTDRTQFRVAIRLRALGRTLLNRTCTMSKFVFCGLHHCICRSEKQNADRPQVDHSVRENLVSGSFQVPKSTVRPVTFVLSENRSNQENVFRQKTLHQEINRFLWKMNLGFILLSGKFSLCEGHRDHVFAKSGNLKLCWPECKVDSLFAFVNFNNKLNPIG